MPSAKKSGQTTIAELLSQGDAVTGHRSREEAQKYLSDFKSVVGLPDAPEPALDPYLAEFLVEAVLSAAWYQRRYLGAQRKVYAYIALNGFLIAAIPLALIGLGTLAEALKTNALVGQITGVLTGILALQKTLSTWYASQQRYAVWYKSAADLKSIYYAFIQSWGGKAGTDTAGFVAALKNGSAAARQLVNAEQLDFYQKLALPTFDILDMLASTRSTVSTFVTSIIPGTTPANVAVVGRNLMVTSPGAGARSGGPAVTDQKTDIRLPTVSVLAEGETKPNDNPYTIVIIANPTLQTTSSQQPLVADPILTQPASFQACVQYARDALFGRLPGQAERFLAQFETKIRVIAIFDPSLTPSSATALVAEYPYGGIVQPLQDAFASLIATYQVKGKPIKADVAFAITASGTHTRSSAYYTADDESSGGTGFKMDGKAFTHRQVNVSPGVVALHVSATSLVALHEFGHAASSWTNGCITDLYVDSTDDYNAVNVRVGRPIPQAFATYAGKTYQSDLTRECLNGYPAGWKSYHCAEADDRYPAIMDDFWLAQGKPENCKHDKITLDFLTDRLNSIMSRV